MLGILRAVGPAKGGGFGDALSPPGLTLVIPRFLIWGEEEEDGKLDSARSLPRRKPLRGCLELGRDVIWGPVAPQHLQREGGVWAQPWTLPIPDVPGTAFTQCFYLKDIWNKLNIAKIKLVAGFFSTYAHTKSFHLEVIAVI